MKTPTENQLKVLEALHLGGDAVPTSTVDGRTVAGLEAQGWAKRGTDGRLWLLKPGRTVLFSFRQLGWKSV